MASTRVIAAAALLALLGGCEARIGEDEAEANGAAAANVSAASVSAEGKAEEGRLSVNAPGFDLKLDIPTGIGNNADFDSDSELVYPGAKLSGMHIEAAGKGGGNDSAVEMRFASADAPAKVAAWYRDPARAGDFALGSARQEGEGWAMSGTAKESGDPFSLRLAPRAGGGTDGRLVLRQSG